MNQTHNDKTVHTVELELLNGDKIVRTFDVKKLYDFRQKTYCKYTLCFKFPFLKKEKRVYSNFRYQVTFSTFRDSSDSRYSVNCALTALMNLFGICCSRWSETILKDAIRHG